MATSKASVIDEVIRSEALALFSGADCGKFAMIRVGVLHGIVHLGGSTNSLADRSQAEELVKKIDHVRGVVNRITSPGAPSPARTVNLNLNHNMETKDE